MRMRLFASAPLTLFLQKGNNYYNEVECKAESESATKVCRNIKYGKDKKP